MKRRSRRTPLVKENCEILENMHHYRLWESCGAEIMQWSTEGSQMIAQEILINRMQDAVDAILKTARAMSEDKLNWQPLDEGRSTIDMLKEVAQASFWFVKMAEAKSEPEISEDQQAGVKEKIASLSSVDEIEIVLQENTQRLSTLIRNCNDADLKLPFRFAGVDKEYLFGEALNFHQSHTMYHLAQINYIQTLYGDKQDHWF